LTQSKNSENPHQIRADQQRLKLPPLRIARLTCCAILTTTTTAQGSVLTC
jgi:hypothetical protein